MILRRLLLLMAASVVASLASGCAVDAAPPAIATSESPASELGVPETAPGAPVSSTPTTPDPAANELARMVLSEALGIPPEGIQVLRAESVDWPDASLGCPQPGAAYAQVVTPGIRFTLEAGGRSYFVHTDLSRSAVLCTDDGVPLEPVFPVEPGEIDDGDPWMPVY
jgi:hypothetical protein